MLCTRENVAEVTDEGVVVQLLWEIAAPVAMPSSWRPAPQPSPISGRVDCQAVSRAFGRLLRPDAEELRCFLREGQPVAVEVRKGPDVADGLALDLSSLQPGEPAVVPQRMGSPASAKEWGAFLEQRRFRVSWEGIERTDHDLWPRLPPAGWEDQDWGALLQQVPAKYRRGPEVDMKEYIFTAWALTDGGRDVAVAGPLTAEERILLYFLPLLRHLRAQPRAPVGGRPGAVVLCRNPYLADGLKFLLARLI